ncbi:MAG: hypothetical protein AAB654_17845, partial [Acidobacteriota bacterium]
MNRRNFFALSAAAALPGSAVSSPASGQRFQKSICDGIVPKSASLEEAFRQVKRAGFDGYEITMGQK